MDKAVKSEIILMLQVVAGLVVLVTCAFIAYFVVAFAMHMETIEKIPSSDGKFAVKMSMIGDATSDTRYEISVESKNGDSKEIAVFCEPRNLEILWSTKNRLSINYLGSKTADINVRCFDLDRERFTVDINPNAAVSIGHKYIAHSEADGIYIQRVDTHQEWLIANQYASHKQLFNRDLDLFWCPNLRLYLFSDKKINLKFSELNDGGQKIRIFLLPREAKYPD
jgi:hypothetical protein